jgi:hypothetical protein
MSGRALDASVTLEEVLTVVGAKRVPLAPELAGYLALEIAENADPSGGDVDPKSVFVGEEGTVALIKPKRDAVVGDAEGSVRAALCRLLEASGSHTPALAAASKRRLGAGLAGLAEELQAALIPVNRAAGRRALARLAREVKRVTLGVGRHTLPSSSALRHGGREAASPPSERRPPASTPRFSPDEDPTAPRTRAPSDVLPRGTTAHWSEMTTEEFLPGAPAEPPGESDVDALISRFGVTGSGAGQHARALQAMIGLDPTPSAPDAHRRLADAPPAAGPPARATRPQSAAPRADSDRVAPVEDGAFDVDLLLGSHGGDPIGSGETPAASRVSSGGGRQLPTQPSQLKMSTASFSTGLRGPTAGSRAVFVAVAVAVLGMGGYAVWRLRPAALVRTVPDRLESAPAIMQEPARPCLGTLVVVDAVPRAEVLLREGQAPVDILRMPVGARLEFVATAEGYAPKRVVVPSGIAWDPGPDGTSRFEAAVQLDPSHARAPSVDPWPAAEPGSEAGGQGPPGTVRVVATPRGAEVWMLAGIGPEAHIDQVQCDQDLEVLIAGPAAYRKRVRVRSSDFVLQESPGGPTPNGASKTARISAR